jgi:glycosyltransferase involved in cell wall biosynthesis
MSEDSRPIMVSIQCLVYNHEPYIRQCLDGFVAQKTNFRFEAIVHDDASTDGSVGIIKEYAEKYPDIIKPIYEEENQYSKHIPGLITNIVNKRCQGKYIAICEGDDYWTDPLKLQKQVDFLEANLDYSMCFHNAKILYEKEDMNVPHEVVEDRDYHGAELFRHWIVPTASIVFRRKVLDMKTIGNERILYGDIVLILTCAEMGNVKGFSDTMSVYRVHENGISHNVDALRNSTYKKIAHYQFLQDNFTTINKWDVRTCISNSYVSCFRLEPFLSRNSILYLLKSMYYNPFVIFIRAWKFISKSNKNDACSL